MLSYIWGGMIAAAVIFSLFTGNAESLSQGTLNSAQDAISLLITMAGILCLWSGIMEIAERCGFTNLISKILSPVLSKLFKGLSVKSKAYKDICMNISANMLGLGNAATPFGLSAMRELDALNHGSSYASNEMVLFVVMNTASIQIIPAMIGTLRQSYGSQTPFDIMPCVWISSASALAVALILAIIFNGISKKPLNKSL
ncbi:MAG: nucleoside recognition domain-containing protein [Ruminococcus sp.]